MKFERDKKQEVYTDQEPIPSNQSRFIDMSNAKPVPYIFIPNLDAYATERMKEDDDFYNILVDLIKYLSATYKDKYEDGASNPARELMLSSPNSDITIWNALKYIKRYQTVGYDKSGDTKDIMKAIHYLLFELQRRGKDI